MAASQERQSPGLRSPVPWTLLSYGTVESGESLLKYSWNFVVFSVHLHLKQTNHLNWIELNLYLQGYAQYSVLFYGYYNIQRSIDRLKFRMPLSYFMVGVGTVAYSYMVVIKTYVYYDCIQQMNPFHAQHTQSVFVITGWPVMQMR